MDRDERLFSMKFGELYRLYEQKVMRKGRTGSELDIVIMWLTGYDDAGLREQIEEGVTLRDFFENAPKINPKANQITGTICGVKIQEIEHPLMKLIRIMDKLVDDLAKGKKMEMFLP